MTKTVNKLPGLVPLANYSLGKAPSNDLVFLSG